MVEVPEHSLGTRDVRETAPTPVPQRASVAVRWGFKESDTRYLTHGLHPYPARMIPQVARRLIDKYSERGQTVYDPMCGSGTVLVEARLLSRNALGMDINPFARLLARVKTTVVPHARLKGWNEAMQRALRPDLVRKARGQNDAPLPEFSLNMGYWFKPYVMRDLALVKAEIERVVSPTEDPEGYEFFSVCFAGTIRDVSNLRSREFKRYRIPEDELKEHRPDVIGTFLRVTSENIRRMAHFEAKCGNIGSGRVDVVAGDARTFVLKDSVPLILTSPPYGDSQTTVAYGQFSSLAMEWLGMNSGASQRVDKQSLGGLPAPEGAIVHSGSFAKVFRKISQDEPERAAVVRSFFYDLQTCVDRMYASVQEGGRCCIVIGDRTVSGVPVPTIDIVREMASNIGFEQDETFMRRIFFKTLPYETVPKGRAGGKERVKAIGREGIIVLRRP